MRRFMRDPAASLRPLCLIRDVAVIATATATVSVGLAIGLEGTKAPTAPACGEVTGIVTGVAQPLEAVGHLDEGAEESGAVVVHQLDQPRLLHQTGDGLPPTALAA
jgi:hypothetical protein